MNVCSLVVMARPRQWLKNLMVFFPPFLSGSLFLSRELAMLSLPFVSFCLASSATYIVNDILDLEQDTRHPEKSRRPLPAGEVSRNSALFLAALVLVTSLLLARQVSSLFLLYVILYLGISFAYSLRLKHLPIFDIFCISFGFVLRLYGGGAAFGVYISDWLFLTVFLLSIFLSVGKRYSEQRSLGDQAGSHRRTLEEYPEGFLEAAMYLSGAAVLVTYSLYVINRPLLVYTVPLCLFGLLRYLMMIKSGGEGDPTYALLKDLPLMVIGVIWVLMVGLSVYL
jgi:decaprenyl-phosphate phosphoribosyltransferase